MVIQNNLLYILSVSSSSDCLCILICPSLFWLSVSVAHQSFLVGSFELILQSLSCLTCFLVLVIILLLYFTLCSSISLALAVLGNPWKSFVCASMHVLRLFPRTSSSVVNNRSYISLSGNIFACSLILLIYLCCFCFTVPFFPSLSKRCAVLRLLPWSTSVCHPLLVGRTRSGPEHRVS